MSDFNINVTSNDGVTNKQINISTTDAGEIKRLVNLAGIMDPSPASEIPNLPAPSGIPTIPTIPHEDEIPSEEHISEPEELETHDHDDLECLDCGQGMSNCDCTGEYIGESLTDYDHGHRRVTKRGEIVDSDEYDYKIPAYSQKIVKGSMGDNPLSKDPELFVGMKGKITSDNLAEKIFTKLANGYAKFLKEDGNTNQGTVDGATGLISPLTNCGRDFIDKDPGKDEKVVDDGSRSPLSRIKR